MLEAGGEWGHTRDRVAAVGDAEIVAEGWRLGRDVVAEDSIAAARSTVGVQVDGAKLSLVAEVGSCIVGEGTTETVADNYNLARLSDSV